MELKTGYSKAPCHLRPSVKLRREEGSPRLEATLSERTSLLPKPPKHSEKGEKCVTSDGLARQSLHLQEIV